MDTHNFKAQGRPTNREKVISDICEAVTHGDEKTALKKINLLNRIHNDDISEEIVRTMIRRNMTQCIMTMRFKEYDFTKLCESALRDGDYEDVVNMRHAGIDPLMITPVAAALMICGSETIPEIGDNVQVPLPNGRRLNALSELLRQKVVAETPNQDLLYTAVAGSQPRVIALLLQNGSNPRATEPSDRIFRMAIKNLYRRRGGDIIRAIINAAGSAIADDIQWLDELQHMPDMCVKRLPFQEMMNLGYLTLKNPQYNDDKLTLPMTNLARNGQLNIEELVTRGRMDVVWHVASKDRGVFERVMRKLT